MRPILRTALALPLVLITTKPALASETIANTYDARGRLVKVERSGSVNNGEKTEYEHDKADNRNRVTTTGA